MVYAIMINEALVPDGLQSSFDARRTSYRQQHADAMLEEGSLDGQRVWKRALATVKEIQREEPGEGELIN